MSDVFVALAICIPALIAIFVIALLTYRLNVKRDRLEYEDKWKQMAHEEAMAQIEAMKPAPLPAAIPVFEPGGIVQRVQKAVRR